MFNFLFLFFLFNFDPGISTISSFNYQLEHYHVACLYSYVYSNTAQNQLIKLYKEEIDNNFIQNKDPMINLNNIIDFFVKNKVKNALTKFVYDLTKNKEIESFIKNNDNNNKEESNNFEDIITTSIKTSVLDNVYKKSENIEKIIKKENENKNNDNKNTKNLNVEIIKESQNILENKNILLNNDDKNNNQLIKN